MITVIAVGNGGCNVADYIRKQSIQLRDAKFIFCDAGAASLYQHGKNGDSFIVLKPYDICFPDMILGDTTKVIIIVTLGGRVGNKFSTIIAEQFKKNGVSEVTALVTIPFAFEGKDRRAKAQKVAIELSEICDNIVIFDNEDLVSTCPELTFGEAFEFSDKALLEAI